MPPAHQPGVTDACCVAVYESTVHALLGYQAHNRWSLLICIRYRPLLGLLREVAHPTLLLAGFPERSVHAHHLADKAEADVLHWKL